jgi:hypothetical protein
MPNTRRTGRLTAPVSLFVGLCKMQFTERISALKEIFVGSSKEGLEQAMQVAAVL